MKGCPNCNSTRIKRISRGKKMILVCKNCGFYNEHFIRVTTTK